ncbi:MAG: TRAP transporter substrate-binding protein DctP, partial [Fretibacterium sp.]|nr:TRAP transporter substrate-binding protein DctP [Fretibacterium sp.]
MKKISILKLAFIIAFAFVLAQFGTEGGSAAFAAQTYTIKLGHTMSTSHPRHISLLEFKKYVEEKTNGNVQIELYPAAVLGSEPDMQESMRMGTLEAFVGGPFDTISKKLNLFLMPFFFDNQEALMRAAKNEKVFNSISTDAEANGLKILAIGRNAVEDFFVFGRPHQRFLVVKEEGHEEKIEFLG